MTRIILASLTFALVFAGQAFSHEPAYYRIASGDSILSFTSNAPVPDKMVQVIAERTFVQSFSADIINSNYYQVQILKNIVWQGLHVTQYDYKPLASDRFRHVLWVYGHTIVKMEIFDTAGELMFSGAYLNADDMPEMQAPSPLSVSAASESFNFYGFTAIKTETSDNHLRVLFTDGLNRFSIFREPSPSGKAESQPDRQVVYANNVYNVTIDGYTYTVVGGLSFERMQEVLEIFITRISKIPVTSGSINENHKQNP